MKPFATAAMLAMLSGAAFAQGTGASGYFELWNDTDANTIVGFYNDDGRGWSNNWLSGMRLGPGQRTTMTFNDARYPCSQVVQVGWLASGGGEVLDDPIRIDICDASNLFARDNAIAYD